MLALGQTNKNSKQSLRSPLGVTIKDIINDEIYTSELSGGDLFKGIDGICTGLGWHYTDFITEFDRWLNLYDPNYFQFNKNFTELTKAGFDKNLLMNVPFYKNMSENMVAAKIHIQK